ncbi:hypothetical protein M0813_15955 [Anaeramoeba flamelloides]|uniref:Uncharacterized protein n=1 Tax=Anaeramoeba flamelloides TaxID=1746091 RepID=A0ABQ8Z1A3_9EUKA|nr:hypothetical protein M0813_15955 [Anaeramoeba flamelloides]
MERCVRRFTNSLLLPSFIDWWPWLEPKFIDNYKEWNKLGIFDDSKWNHPKNFILIPRNLSTGKAPLEHFPSFLLRIRLKILPIVINYLQIKLYQNIIHQYNYETIYSNSEKNKLDKEIQICKQKILKFGLKEEYVNEFFDL